MVGWCAVGTPFSSPRTLIENASGTRTAKERPYHVTHRPTTHGISVK